MSKIGELKMSRVLVIDGNRIFASCLQLALERKRHEVLVAANLRSGLALARSQEFEVVVCDLHCKGGSGRRDCTKTLKSIRELHALKPRVRIIALATDLELETTFTAYLHGAYCVTKPGTEEEMNELLATIQKAATFVKPAWKAGSTHVNKRSEERGSAGDLAAPPDLRGQPGHSGDVLTRVEGLLVRVIGLVLLALTGLELVQGKIGDLGDSRSRQNSHPTTQEESVPTPLPDRALFPVTTNSTSVGSGH